MSYKSIPILLLYVKQYSNHDSMQYKSIPII